MNKKLVALALVLLLAVGGLFATYTVTVPGDVTALLKANVGEFLEHGFTVNSVKYQSSIEILDAFETNPSFVYGYRTNAQGAFEFRMTVGDFKHTNGSNIVKIADVKKGSTSPVAIDPVSGESYYLLFSENNAVSLGTVTHTGEDTFTIIPATATGTDHLGGTISAGQYIGDATAGSYTSTVTILISAS